MHVFAELGFVLPLGSPLRMQFRGAVLAAANDIVVIAIAKSIGSRVALGRLGPPKIPPPKKYQKKVKQRGQQMGTAAKRVFNRLPCLLRQKDAVWRAERIAEIIVDDGADLP
eukprot:3759443-Amphidinium_carterae.1